MKKQNKNWVRIVAVICAFAMLGTVLYSVILGFLGYL